MSESLRETVAVVVVTHNRADLLVGMLDGLAAQTRRPDAVVVVDNASTDRTGEVLAARTDLPLQVITQDNLGGAGGFHRGVRAAYDAGWRCSWGPTRTSPWSARPTARPPSVWWASSSPTWS